MPAIDEPASFEPKTPTSKRKAKSRTTEPAAISGLIAFTLDAGSGRLVKIERVEADGAQREFSFDEQAELASSGSQTDLERLFERAFEAGIDCVLGDRPGEAESPEATADAELSRLLVRSLFADSSAAGLVDRHVLNRAIVGWLIAQSATSETPAGH